ncbi:MAG: hypothetical protein ACFFAJ_05340 [Candidatus Hodarchaeota archaeon]
MAIIVSFVIAELVSLDIFLSFFFFPDEISVPYPFNFLGVLAIVLGSVLVGWANYALLFQEKSD